jgi:hypothetical protein
VAERAIRQQKALLAVARKFCLLQWSKGAVVMRLAEDRKHGRIIDANQFGRYAPLTFFQILYGRRVVVYVPFPRDLFQHFSRNRVRADSRFCAYGPRSRSYVQAFTVLGACSDVSIDFPRPGWLLLIAVEMTLFVFLARAAPARVIPS